MAFSVSAPILHFNGFSMNMTNVTRIPIRSSLLDDSNILFQAAKHTVDKYVENGMVVGLGSGRASGFAIRYLGRQLQSGAIKDVIGIPMAIYLGGMFCSYIIINNSSAFEVRDIVIKPITRKEIELKSVEIPPVIILEKPFLVCLNLINLTDRVLGPFEVRISESDSLDEKAVMVNSLQTVILGEVQAFSFLKFQLNLIAIKHGIQQISSLAVFVRIENKIYYSLLEHEVEKKKKSSLYYCLPEDLVFEILEWLPIKSVARFMCVSKPWASQFKAATFIENHRRKQDIRGIGNMLLVRRCLQFNVTESVLSFHDLDAPEFEIRPSQSITFLKDLLNIEKDTTAFHLLGCCNGIICIMYQHRYVLCNPALRQFKPLPPFPGHGWRVRDGFGADSTNNFKVVVMYTTEYKYPLNGVNVHVYSSRTDSWRQIDDAPVRPVGRSAGDVTFNNGACHWAGHTFAGDRKLILSLDINLEVFKQLELPESLRGFDIADPIPIVLNLNQCLLGLVQYQENSVEVWGMKEYGIKESWTKMFSISNQPLAFVFRHFRNDIMFMLHEPIFCQPNWEGVKQEDRLELDKKLTGQLTAVSLRTDELKNYQVFGARRTTRALIYRETLVRLY